MHVTDVPYVLYLWVKKARSLAAVEHFHPVFPINYTEYIMTSSYMRRLLLRPTSSTSGLRR